MKKSRNNSCTTYSNLKISLYFKMQQTNLNEVQTTFELLLNNFHKYYDSCGFRRETLRNAIMVKWKLFEFSL